MIFASMTTHTPVTDFMEMTIPRFLRIFVAICKTLEKRRNAME